MDIPEIPKSDPILPPWEITSLKGLVTSVPPWEEIIESAQEFVPPFTEAEIAIEEKIIDHNLSGTDELATKLTMLSQAHNSTLMSYEEAIAAFKGYQTR